MSNPPKTTAAESPSLESVLADYLERCEAGQSPDPGDYLRTYPQFAGDLRSFFRNHHWLGEAPPKTSLIGTRIATYTIEAEIARGGMGVVYRARQVGLQRPVALKLINSGVLAGEEQRRRFRLEAEAAAQLQHPGIVAIHETGSWDGYEFFSMALVQGHTLQQWVDDQVFDDRRNAQVVRDVARAVAYAHRHGIVHRDLKPENILVDEDGRPLVTDFGLAKWHREGTLMTRTGQVLGTPHYMSPEQAGGCAGGSPAIDIYSLGAVLYALLTGRPPHVGDSTATVLRSVLQDDPPPPRALRASAPPDLEAICLKALRHEPDQRYASADELADDLNRFLDGERPSANTSGLVDRVARELRRDQHQSYFDAWGRTLFHLGGIIFAAHGVIYALSLAQVDQPLAIYLPRAVMLAAIFAVIYRARDGAVLPRSSAERPVWSIWLGYLATLLVVNVMVLSGGLDRIALFSMASLMSGFGFIAMSGHVWGGSAVLGLGFLAGSLWITAAPSIAPLLFGLFWLISLTVLGRHYRGRTSVNG